MKRQTKKIMALFLTAVFILSNVTITPMAATNLKEDEEIKQEDIVAAKWHKVDDDWYYGDNKEYVIDQWLMIDGVYYYFEEDGKMAAGEWYEGYWLDASGAWTYPATGAWYQNSVGWWYQDSFGWYPVNQWQKIDGSWYYFNEAGYMVTGWQIINGTWYYFDAVSGDMAESEWVNGYWLNAGGSWTYMAIGSWRLDSIGWWYQDGFGWYPTNQWQKIDNVWYFFDEAGYLVGSEEEIKEKYGLEREDVESMEDIENPNKDEEGMTDDENSSDTDLPYGDDDYFDDEYDDGIIDATDYTYEIIPLLEPFNEMFYLKTDNPMINNLMFVDEDSKYYTESTEEKDYLSINGTAVYYDVEYELDYETIETSYGEVYEAFRGKVKGGYILKSYNKGNDGGEFTLYVDKGQRWNGTEYEDYIENTGIKISCPEVEDYCEYLIENYTSEDQSLFENLSDVHDMLWENSIYPRNVALDGTDMSDTEKYPYLYAYSYPEMDLGAETCVYPETSYLVNELYPFTLNSSSFPGTMNVIAKRLEPDCVVSAGPIHSYIEVEYNGESHLYGGAGQGGTAPVYASDVSHFFKFDGSQSDFSNGLTLDTLTTVAWEYVELAMEKASPIGSALSGAGFYEAIGTGSWLRIHGEITNTETGEEYPVYSYAYTWEAWNYHYENDPFYPEDVWIDGRYVNKYNYFEPGATFDEHPTAYILIRAFTYTDAYGDVYTEDIKFKYDETTDAWYAINLTGDIIINVNQTKYDYPEEFILTREEIEEMDVDRNTNVMPESGLIYDGTVEPGTPFGEE